MCRQHGSDPRWAFRCTLFRHTHAFMLLTILFSNCYPKRRPKNKSKKHISRSLFRSPFFALHDVRSTAKWEHSVGGIYSWSTYEENNALNRAMAPRNSPLDPHLQCCAGRAGTKNKSNTGCQPATLKTRGEGEERTRIRNCLPCGYSSFFFHPR